MASAFASSPLSYGDLASYVTDTLTGFTDSSAYIKQVTSYINSLPN